MTTSINTESAATSAINMAPLSYDDKNAISAVAEAIREELGLRPGQELTSFGDAMAAYGHELLRVPTGIINGYKTKADGTPKLLSGFRTFVVEIKHGLRGLKGIVDYRTGNEIENQAFVQVFIKAADWNLADDLISQGMVFDLVIRPVVTNNVVRFELVDTSSKLGKSLMQIGGYSNVASIPVVLPVEAKANDQTTEGAQTAARMTAREENGTEVYNLTSTNPVVRKIQEVRTAMRGGFFGA
jgi:hypothetical protein